MNSSPFHTMRFRKKSNFTLIKTQFQIKSNLFLSEKSNFTLKQIQLPLEEIQFHIGRYPISQMKKSNFTLEEIQCQIGRNLILHWKKSNFTVDEIQFHIGRNPSSLIMKKLTYNSKVHP